MKKLLITAVLAASVLATPSLAIKRSTAEKYINTSDIVQVAGCWVEDLDRISSFDHYFSIELNCPGGYVIDLPSIRTDQLFGVRTDGKIDNNHPITVEYRNIKNWDLRP